MLSKKSYKYTNSRLQVGIVITIIVLAFIVRFYNFSQRVTFGPEQAISLIHSGDIIKNGPTLLGIENVQRFTSSGHKLFSGVVFSYILVPLQILSTYQPVQITAYFAILNVLTGLLIYFVAKKMFGYKTGVFSLILFLFCSTMINHSLYIWILNFLPIIGILMIYFLYLFYKQKRNLYIIILGILTGLGVNFEYFYIFTGILIFLILWRINKKFFQTIAPFFAGVVLGNITMLIFDMRNDFYHMRTVWQYFIDTLYYDEATKISYYHFLQFWPLLAILGGLILSKLYDINKQIALLFLAVFIFVNLYSSDISFTQPTGMPSDLTVGNIYKTAELIDKDLKTEDFNVAVLVDFDTRGHILRYHMEYEFDRVPMGEEDYPNANALYVLAEHDYNFNDSGTWEIYAYKPFSVVFIDKIGGSHSLFKLEHEQ